MSVRRMTVLVPVTRAGLADLEWLRQAVLHPPQFTAKELVEQALEREKRMAACPYVACECGWHEDP